MERRLPCRLKLKAAFRWRYQDAPRPPRHFAITRKQLITPLKRVVTKTFPPAGREPKFVHTHALVMNNKARLRKRTSPPNRPDWPLENTPPGLEPMNRFSRAPRNDPGHDRNGHARRRFMPFSLPGYDSQTARMETGVFLILSILAVAAIVFAAQDGARFSENRLRIAAALESGGVIETARTSARDTNHVQTNVTVLPAFAPETRAGVGQPTGDRS